MMPFAQAHGSADVDELLREAEARAGAAYQDLYGVRLAVEAGAFDETLRLCAGEWRAWAQIFKEGVDQPYSVLDGPKADYAAAMNLRVWNLESWLYSVHALYLVNSDGFRRAAAQCLGTTEQTRIDRFAAAVIRTDVAGTLVSEVALGAGVAQIFFLAARSTRWAWRPVVRGFGRLRARVPKKAIAVAGVVTAPVAAGAAINYVVTVRRGVRGAEDFLAHLGDERRQLKATALKLLMANVVKRLGEGLDRNDLHDFETWTRTNVHAADRAQAHEDFLRIQAGDHPEPGDQQYGSVLKAVLPALDQLELAP